jgi:phosphatidylserine decarboxylase
LIIPSPWRKLYSLLNNTLHRPICGSAIDCSGLNFIFADAVEPHFITTYKITTEELLVPELDRYRTFNEFFFRKLKPGARSVDDPETPTRIVSPADSRSVFYPVSEVRTYWIKVQPPPLSFLLPCF